MDVLLLMQAYSFAEAQHLTMGPDWNLLTR